ncbi:hypothetical protein [Paenibacillus koleovorans]|uniref:hypothetical protein n=1 Tax=Paenibacillus koleovorans TaxID=121608 RepID=UPI0013E317B4|nr:hypothetical protein [Paenibacillus koleovorans]
MFFMTVDDPMFKWVILGGILSFGLSVVLEIRYRRNLKKLGLRPGEHPKQQDRTNRH